MARKAPSVLFLAMSPQIIGQVIQKRVGIILGWFPFLICLIVLRAIVHKGIVESHECRIDIHIFQLRTDTIVVEIVRRKYIGRYRRVFELL